MGRLCGHLGEHLEGTGDPIYQGGEFCFAHGGDFGEDGHGDGVVAA